MSVSVISLSAPLQNTQTGRYRNEYIGTHTRRLGKRRRGKKDLMQLSLSQAAAAPRSREIQYGHTTHTHTHTHIHSHTAGKCLAG
mmetsp:Transcript_1034/g.2301  ORF Transcript_1034/g.2301 Transcript_1034/m.2301 type:complete len:85 (+) Transcript_1034:783-1037(+)